VSAVLQTLLAAASLLASAVVPVGTLVLATALMADDSRAESGTTPPVGQAAMAPESAAIVDLSDASDALTRGGVAAELVIGVVRLVLMPLLTLGIGAALVSTPFTSWIVPADPLARLLLCAQGCMPSAQNLVLLLTLRRATQRAAPKVAKALVRQYLAAALPCAAWMALFTRILL
jgi:hypothetical protein